MLYLRLKFYPMWNDLSKHPPEIVDIINYFKTMRWDYPIYEALRYEVNERNEVVCVGFHEGDVEFPELEGDFSFCSKLKNLKSISFEIEIIKNLEFLNTLEYVETVYVEGGLIKLGDYKPNSSLKDLSLYGGYYCDNLEFLADATEIENLTIWVKKDVDASLVNAFTQLKKLSLGYEELSLLSVDLEKLNLESLVLFSADNVCIQNCDELKTLNLIGCKNISLIKFPNLQSIRFESIELNELKNLQALSASSKLWNFTYENSKNDDFRFLEDFTNLVELRLSNNEIRNLDFLDGLNNIGKLFLDNNLIDDIFKISQLPCLCEIGLANNQIQYIPDFRSNNLKAVFLEGNLLTELPTLQQQSGLYNLRVSNNHIRAIRELPLSLVHLEVSENDLEYLDVSNCSKLYRIICKETKIKSKDDLISNKYTNIDFQLIV